jgi:hypothetical protein
MPWVTLENGTKVWVDSPNFGEGDVGDKTSTNPYSGGGSGGGSGGISAKEKQAANNLASVAGYNQDTITGNYDNQNKIHDISDKQNKRLAAVQTTQARRNAGNDWYTQQQKLQSVTSQLTDAMGNAAMGSGLYDMWDAIARKDDMDDVAVLNQLRENRNSIDNNLFEALAASNISRNQTAADTERALREIGADYAAQINNINPKLGKGVFDTKDHTLNLPSWIQEAFFNKNKRKALKPTEQPLVREAGAASDAWSRGLLTGEHNTASSSNQTYQQRLSQGYSRRTQ